MTITKITNSFPSRYSQLPSLSSLLHAPSAPARQSSIILQCPALSRTLARRLSNPWATSSPSILNARPIPSAASAL